jgi:hypothetical protein
MEIIPKNKIEDVILNIRGLNVILDRDIASLYGVKTKRLNEQVKRNIKRFPDDFMFRLSKDERDELVTNCDRFINLKHSSVLPVVFTEHGIAMLSSILNSETAINVSIQIIRTFIYLRKSTLSLQALSNKLSKLEKRYDQQFEDVFLAIRTLIEKPNLRKNKIGFNREKN